MLLSWSSGGRLFYATGQATANARGPMVTVLVAGMNRSPDAAERKCDNKVLTTKFSHVKVDEICVLNSNNLKILFHNLKQSNSFKIYMRNCKLYNFA